MIDVFIYNRVLVQYETETLFQLPLAASKIKHESLNFEYCPDPTRKSAWLTFCKCIDTFISRDDRNVV